MGRDLTTLKAQKLRELHGDEQSDLPASEINTLRVIRGHRVYRLVIRKRQPDPKREAILDQLVAEAQAQNMGYD